MSKLVAATLCLFLLVALSVAVLAQQTTDAKMRPRGGLFSEEGGDRAVSLAWFLGGLYVLAGLIFAGASAHLAIQKALPPVPWFLAGFFLNAIGYLFLLTRPPGNREDLPAGIPAGLHKVPQTYTHYVCPGCSATVHPAARACPGCGAPLEPQFESEADKWRRQRQSKPN